MSVLIDEVVTEIAEPREETGVTAQERSEATAPSTGDSEKKVIETIRHFEKRQLRLLAD